MAKNRTARRHHFIPRLLLKGFADRASQEFYAFEFRREAKPQRKNIRQIGFANKFYGDAGLEEQLATSESSYAALLDNLRKDQINESDNPLINELVSHLLMRTQNLRRGLEEFCDTTISKILQGFEETQIGGEFHRGVTNKIKTDPRLQQLMNLVPSEKRQAFRHLLDQKVQSPELWRETMKQMRQNMETVDLGKAARNAQLQALSSETAYKTRLGLMQPFRWTVYRSSPNTFLLGDVGPIGRQKSSSDWRNLLTFEGITEICLPISHERVLHGNVSATPTQVDPTLVNLGSIELSRDFFVARINSSCERDYICKLGSRSKLVTSEEMESWATQEIGIKLLQPKEQE